MKTIKTAFLFFLTMTLLTGVVYPLLMTLIGQRCFPAQANGSFLTVQGNIVGSELIAQRFTDSQYFWPRPSAVDYNPLPSGGSNLGLGSHAFQRQLQATKGLPDELRMASASGLDPQISPETAKSQISRILAARGLPKHQQTKLLRLVDTLTEPRTFGFLGEPRVNVLRLNLALSGIL